MAAIVQARAAVATDRHGRDKPKLRCYGHLFPADKKAHQLAGFFIGGENYSRG